MTIQDLINAADDEPPRFQKWLAWVLPEEIEPDSQGNIPVENQHDGAGYTVAGMTQRDDGVTVITSPGGQLVCTNSPAWFVSKYYAKYWNGCRAGDLPMGVGECVANFFLNTGRGVRFLQLALCDRGIPVTVDNIIGPQTTNSTWKDPNSKALAQAICARAMAYYTSIAPNYPPEDLEDWTRRTSDLQSAFCQ
jgi:lysozyme family protein